MPVVPPPSEGGGGRLGRAFTALRYPDFRRVWVAALVSNTGTWVKGYRCGTAVVSTMPTTFDGSIRSVLNLPGSKNPTRGSIDLDDYSGGFGQWSGTSFAAPALAGDVAAWLVTHATPDADAAARVKLAGRAVAAAVKGDH